MNNWLARTALIGLLAVHDKLQSHRSSGIPEALNRPNALLGPPANPRHHPVCLTATAGTRTTKYIYRDGFRYSINIVWDWRTIVCRLSEGSGTHDYRTGR